MILNQQPQPEHTSIEADTMPCILHTVHSWSGYTKAATVDSHPTTMVKRDFDVGSGVGVFVIAALIVLAILVLALFLRWVRSMYARSGGTARGSTHQQHGVQPLRTHRPRRARTRQDEESGYEMPRVPPRSYSGGGRSNRANTSCPSQSLNEYLRSQVVSAESANAEERRCGAPHVEEYYGAK